MAVVALESTVFAHCLPRPDNLEVALELERVVKRNGAEPRTIGILDGEVVVGLSEDQIRTLANSTGVRKASQRDLPIILARRGLGATTVATTAWIAHQTGINVVCTGGLGGVHRNRPYDVSNDLHVLANTPITVVCSGAKAILDLRSTREFLESAGVTVVGFGTSELPAFYSRQSGLSVDVRCDTVEEVAEIVRARLRLGLAKATLVTVPIPEESEIPQSEIEPVIDEAEREAEACGIGSAELTPFLLDRVAAFTAGRSLAANRALLLNNAAVAAQIAIALA